MLAILFRSFGFHAPKYFKIIGFPIFRLERIPDEGYSRNASCALRFWAYTEWMLLQKHVVRITFDIYVFSSPGQRPSLGVRRPSSSVVVRPSVVRRKLSHLNLLLWNLWTKLNQTWQGWSLSGSLSKLCPTASPSIQDGCCY